MIDENNGKKKIQAPEFERQKYEEARQRYEKEQQRKREEQINSIENHIAKIIKIMAWVTLGIGIIASIIVAQPNIEATNDLDFAIMFEGWLISGIATISLLSFSEIIQILHDIRAKVYKK